MAPGILLAESQQSVMTHEDLKLCDIWALEMVCFIILNPDMTVPYEVEMDANKDKTEAGFKNLLMSMARKKLHLLFSSKYATF